MNGTAGEWEEGEFFVGVPTPAPNFNRKNQVLR